MVASWGQWWVNSKIINSNEFNKQQLQFNHQHQQSNSSRRQSTESNSIQWQQFLKAMDSFKDQLKVGKINNSIEPENTLKISGNKYTRRRHNRRRGQGQRRLVEIFF